jgi:hypothetical protein
VAAINGGFDVGRHHRELSLLGIILGALACGNPVGSEALCTALVRIDDVTYAASGMQVSDSLVDAQVFAEVTIAEECVDEPTSRGGTYVITGPATVPGSHDIADAESNFLPLGTTIYRVIGSDPGEKLAVWSSDQGSWLVLLSLSSATAEQ